MSHGPATEWKKQESEGYKSRLGLIMFAVYCILYLAFMLIAVLNPKIMGADVGKLNLAITFGFGLIVVAIAQALIYNYMCNKRERGDSDAEESKGEVAK